MQRLQSFTRTVSAGDPFENAHSTPYNLQFVYRPRFLTMPKASSFSRFTRGVRHTVRAFASTKHPVLVHIVPMRRCNLACTYCNEYDKTSDPVAIDVMLERIDKLAEFGSSVITISGGEPMMHPEIYEIIARIRHHGMIAGLISNGYYFQPEKVKKLKN